MYTFLFSSPRSAHLPSWPIQMPEQPLYPIAMAVWWRQWLRQWRRWIQHHLLWYVQSKGVLCSLELHIDLLSLLVSLLLIYARSIYVEVKREIKSENRETLDWKPWAGRQVATKADILGSVSSATISLVDASMSRRRMYWSTASMIMDWNTAVVFG